MITIETIKTFEHGVFVMLVDDAGNAMETTLESEAAAHAYVAALNAIAAK